jgi:hypothetical protein
LAPKSLPREKQHLLRRIHLRNKGGLTLRASGIHIRRDIGDESADVDIATTDGEPVAAALTPVTSVPSDIKRPSPTRSRRPPPASPAKAALQTNPDKCAPAKKDKPKSETYKQAWSISEQHLLERLLTEIPDGEKNR